MSLPRSALRTTRLRLEPVGPEHADALWDATSASLEQLRPWMAWTRDASPQTTRAFTEAAVEAWATGHEYPFAIVHDGLPVGTVGLHARNPLSASAEIGYWVRTDRARQGIVTEAAGRVVQYAFGDLGLHRLQLLAGIENAASQRVAEKLGFRREGTLRHAGANAWGFYDCYVFGLLADDRAGSG